MIEPNGLSGWGNRSVLKSSLNGVAPSMLYWNINMHTSHAFNPHHDPTKRHRFDVCPLLNSVLLTAAHTKEVLDFLALRPLQTIIMVSLIHDNGMESSFNRGTFFGYRNAQGTLEGVALIGHAVLVESRSLQALEALARRAQKFTSAHLILGEQEQIENFWRFYAKGGQPSRFGVREWLFEQKWPLPVYQEVPNLRLATLADLPLVLPIHAQMAFEESGVNPLNADPAGFRLRYARRIEQQRLWLWTEDDQVIFKADVVSQTPQVAYVEGIYVNPQQRGQGWGLRCLSQLSRTLLAHTSSIALLVNEQNTAGQKLYYRAGFQRRSNYHTIFLEKHNC